KQSGACRHVIAGMLYLNDFEASELRKQSVYHSEPKLSEAMFSYKESEKAISELLTLSKKEIARQTDSLHKDPVFVEYILNVSGTKANPVYDLYMKIGKEYLYIVKNTAQTVEDIMNDEEVYFGK